MNRFRNAIAAAAAAALVSGAGLGCSKDAQRGQAEGATPAHAEPDPAAKPAAAGNAADPSDGAGNAAGDTAGIRPGNTKDLDMTTLFDTPVNTLEGEPSSLGAHKGKALLVVNVASKCGLTPQYADLEKLHAEYEDRGFAVVGFPCNQFGGQEPGTAEEIKQFCSLTYGVTFPMFEKIEVNGDGRHPVYRELTKIADAGGEAGDIQWNFEKFLISADGKTITRFRPKTKPYDPTVIAALEAGLPAK